LKLKLVAVLPLQVSVAVCSKVNETSAASP
jgi:hypothetical protein